MLSQHVGKHLNEGERAGWVSLVAQAANEAGSPNDAEFRVLLFLHQVGSHVAWENSQQDTRQSTCDAALVVVCKCKAWSTRLGAHSTRNVATMQDRHQHLYDTSMTPPRKIRPMLNLALSVADFRRFYWLKEELVAFCREQRLSTAGSKIAIFDRIVAFLETGKVEIPPKPRAKTPRKSHQQAPCEPLSVRTLITKDYRNSQANREFFTSVIGAKFHFTTRFMNFMKHNVGKTYQDAIDEWYCEEAGKKDGSFQTDIAPQFEYNQHMRTFFVENPGKSRQDAIAAWNEKKAKPDRGK